MSPAAEVLVGLVILVGLIGVVVPILPGTLLIFGAILVWAIMTGGATAWTVFALSALALVVTGIVKYTWPGKRMKSGGVPNLSVVVGGVVGIIGFFVIPVVGLFLGFIHQLALALAARWILGTMPRMTVEYVTADVPNYKINRERSAFFASSPT